MTLVVTAGPYFLLLSQRRMMKDEALKDRFNRKNFQPICFLFPFLPSIQIILHQKKICYAKGKELPFTINNREYYTCCECDVLCGMRMC